MDRSDRDQTANRYGGHRGLITLWAAVGDKRVRVFVKFLAGSFCTDFGLQYFCVGL